MKTDAETQREHEHEAHPFTDAGIRIDIHPFIETEQEVQNGIEHEEESECRTGKKEPQADRKEHIDITLLVRVEPGGDKPPDLQEDPGT